MDLLALFFMGAILLKLFVMLRVEEGLFEKSSVSWESDLVPWEEAESLYMCSLCRHLLVIWSQWDFDVTPWHAGGKEEEGEGGKEEKSIFLSPDLLHHHFNFLTGTFQNCNKFWIRPADC